MRIITWIFFLLSSYISQAQFFNDERSKKTVAEGLDLIYNGQFTAAEKRLSPVIDQYANHPIAYVLKATKQYWQYYPISDSKTQSAPYLENLKKCASLAEQMIKQHKDVEEAHFYLLYAKGSLAHYYNAHNDYYKALVEAKSAYNSLKKGMELVSKVNEFYLTNGLYKFYRVQYPETHPVVKPLIYFFEGGNKNEGLADLRKAINKSLFSKVEATYYLAGICLKYENRINEALALTSKLYEKYPNNQVFMLKYAEALVRAEQPAKAKVILAELHKSKLVDSQLAYLVFSGQVALLEQKLEEAKSYFNAALQFGKKAFDEDDLNAMAWLGLAQVYDQKGDTVKAKQYAKKSLDTAEYEHVKSKAKELLK